MKAIRVHQFGDPDVLKLEDVPDPSPGVGEVVVRVQAIGVNPVEAYIRAGIYGDRPKPFTPGSDAGGVVESVGQGVTRFKPGDRVYTAGSASGTYAQKTLCPENRVFPLPEKITFAKGLRSACRMERLTERSSAGAVPRPAKRSWFTVPAAALASRRSNSPGRPG